MLRRCDHSIVDSESRAIRSRKHNDSEQAELEGEEGEKNFGESILCDGAERHGQTIRGASRCPRRRT